MRRFFRFSVRDLLWLTLVVALALGWFAHQRQLRMDADMRLRKVVGDLQEAVEGRFLDKLSPAQGKLYVLSKRVNEGMSEQEVDSILSGYPGRSDSPSATGQYTKSYDQPGGAKEGDYGLLVTFDKEHCVVRAWFIEYPK